MMKAPPLREVFLLEIEVDSFDELERFNMADSQARIIPDISFDREEPGCEDFVEMAGDDFVKPKNDQHAKAMAKLGFVEKLNSSMFYHPDHWEPVESYPPKRQDQYWYWTGTNDRVALKAKTAEARKWLAHTGVKEHNTPWGSADSKNPGTSTNQAYAWLTGKTRDGSS